MRMTIQVQSILAIMLAEPAREYYGLELANAARLRSGTLYPILRRLEEAGWVSADWEQIDPVKAGRPARRFYRLTGTGTAAATAALADTRRRLGWPQSEVAGGLT